VIKKNGSITLRGVTLLTRGASRGNMPRRNPSA
jgi:hypothetical protein